MPMVVRILKNAKRVLARLAPFPGVWMQGYNTVYSCEPEVGHRRGPYTHETFIALDKSIDALLRTNSTCLL